jgi:two-component system, NarL family, sensor histidine kinase DevS
MRSPVAPSFRLLIAVAAALLSALLCTIAVRSTPWLGVSFVHTNAGSTLTLASVDFGVERGNVAVGDSLVSLRAAGLPAVHLTPQDLLEEPDFLDTWAMEDAFYARQSALSAILRAPQVEVETRASDGVTVHTAAVTPRQRPLTSLPLIFWLQLCFGAAGLIIGTWVWVLRSDDWGPRVYAITGACFLIFAHAAAIYSARELALPGGFFRTLSGINHFGAIHFGAALCALFLVYPRLLVKREIVFAAFAAFFVWWLACVSRVAPDQNWGSRFPVMLAMLGALVIALVQWRRTKGDPAARAVLRWFAVSVLTGCGAFIGLTAVVSSIGGLPPIPQGYAFGFFLLMYAGLAIGLRQYKVFALDQWAYRMLFWGLAVAIFIAIDLYLLGTAGSVGTRTFALAAFLALGTFPVRRWVWNKLFAKAALPPEQLFEKALHVTYATNDAERDTRWRTLLKELFDPLHAATDSGRDKEHAGSDVDLVAQGRELAVPAVASSPALRLTYASGGKRLFTPDDQQLVRTLVSLMHNADESRKAYDVGVARERSRIARDLHDTVSSPLLAGLAPVQVEGEAAGQMALVQSEIRRAVQGMRHVVSGDSVTAAPLADCVADARFAAMERLKAAGLTADWPITDVGEYQLSPNERHAFAALIQESITNIIRHAHATHVDTQVTVDADQLRVSIVDDGRGFNPDPTRRGDGLPNLQARAAALNGSVTIGARRDGTSGTAVELVAQLIAAGVSR